MVVAEVEAIQRTKIKRAQLVQLYKEDKEWDTWPTDDEIVNKDNDDKGHESEDCGELWKNYKDEKYIINKQLELVWQKCL